jgi:hypothetical protein
MVGGDFSVRVPSFSVEMGIGRAEPDDGYRSGHLVRIRGVTPLGRADLDASDAAKFLAISGVSPWMLAIILCGIAGITAALVTRYFRLPASTAT